MRVTEREVAVRAGRTGVKLALAAVGGLLVLNCAPPTMMQSCFDLTEGGFSCGDRTGCSDTEACVPDGDYCSCSALPCDEFEPGTCSHGACSAGLTCVTSTPVVASVTVPAGTDPLAPVTTALTLQPGDTVSFSATGSTTYGNEGQVGCSGTPAVDPDGNRSIGVTPCSPASKDCSGTCAVPGSAGQVGQLVARIGSGSWFVVGSSRLYTVDLGESGALQLAYNDDNGGFGDNTGSYDVDYGLADGCHCVSPLVTTGATRPASPTCEMFAPPIGATLQLSTHAPGASAEHVATFDVSMGAAQGYQATITYPPDFGFAGFLALGPANSRIGTYALDLDFDGTPDYTTWIRSTGADTAYADIDLSHAPSMVDATLTRGSGNTFVVTAPDGGDQNPATIGSPTAMRVTVKLAAGVLVNPPTNGEVQVQLTITSVDPDTGGADDGVGTPPETFSAEQDLPIGCVGAADCDDGDACTDDTCTAGVCTNSILAGFPGPMCELGDLLADGLCGSDPVDAKLGRAIGAKVGKSRHFLERAMSLTKPKKQVKFARRADGQLSALLRAIKKATKKHKIAGACGTTLDGLVAARRELIRALM